MTPPRRSAGQAATAAVSIAAAFALTATGAAPGAAATPLLRGDYPSWSEVQAAKRNESTTRAEIQKLEGILAELRTEADRLGKNALMKGEEAAIARQALADAEATSIRLAAQVADAQKRADDSAALASGLVARLARTGGGDPTLAIAFSSESDADALLSRLQTMSKLSSSSAALMERAIFDKRAVGALTDEAAVAETERQRLAADAQETADAAQEAAEEVQRRLEHQMASQSVLYAQLASLKGTTAELERQYQEGLAWQDEQNQAPAPTPSNSPSPQPSPSSPSNSPSPSPSPNPTTPSSPSPSPSPSHTPQPDPPGGDEPAPPPPSSSQVNGAIAYAKAQLGKPYGNSMGPNSFDCSGLVKSAYASVGVYVGPWGSTSQYTYLSGQKRLVPVGQMQAGDLLFYSTGGSTSGVKYHVTMYIGGGQMVEAPYPGVTVRIAPVRHTDLVPYVGRPTG